LVFSLISYWLFAWFGRLRPKRSVNFKIAVRNLARNKLTTGACFLAISLGSLLIALVPQLHDLILDEIARPEGYQQPSLFLIDIQEDQLEDLQTFVAGRQIKLDYVSPMVTARMTKINGKDLERYDKSSKITREQQRAAWARTRGQNLSYRQDLSSSEKLLSGRAFSGPFVDNGGNLPELSVEMRYAQRLNIAIDDTLTFDVQGVELTGRVVNTRRVRWTTFQPNFFVYFQEGVLNDAPKTFLASIPQLVDLDKAEIQNALVEKFPNVSIIDIASTISRVLEIVNKMGWIIHIMAYFAIFAGFVVLFSIASHQAQIRRWDTALAKVLGASFADIRWMVFYEFGILGSVAAVVGTAGSFVVSYCFSNIIFDSPWTFSWQVPLLTVVGITLLSITTAMLATRRVLREKPLALLV